MASREKTCCFTGHRTAKLPWRSSEDDERCIALRSEISARLDGIYEAGYRHFICGMALGCDMYFAEAVILLRERHPDVTLEAAVPCRTQSDRWNRKQKQEYDRLLGQCDIVTVLSEEYTTGCMMARNRYMVDNSSLLLACYAGIPGGSRNTMSYARRQDITVIIIDIDSDNTEA